MAQHLVRMGPKTLFGVIMEKQHLENRSNCIHFSVRIVWRFGSCEYKAYRVGGAWGVFGDVCGFVIFLPFVDDLVKLVSPRGIVIYPTQC